MKLKIKKIITSVMLTLSFAALLPGSTVMAGACSGGSFIFPRWYDNLCAGDGQSIMSPNELSSGGNAKNAAGDTSGQTSSTASNIGGWLAIIALNIVQILLYVVGYTALIFIIWGGFKYMTQGDSSSGTVAARKTIQNAIIGLVLSILSVAIIKFVTSYIGGS